MKYTIDAQGKKLGRVASQAALYLRGKGSASFVPNELPDAQVEIVNAAKLPLRRRKVCKQYISVTPAIRRLRETQLPILSQKKDTRNYSGK